MWQKLATDIYLDMNTLAHINVNTTAIFVKMAFEYCSLNKIISLETRFSRRALTTKLTAFSPPFFSNLVSGVINNFWVF